MALSQAALQAILASATEKVFLECLTISHSSNPNILRLVNDKQNLIRASGTYNRFPFQVTAPAQVEGSPPILRFTATTVDQTVILALRTLAGLKERAKIVYEVVRADAPDTVEFGPVEFEFESASSNNMLQITIEASFLRGALNDQFPGRLITPSNAKA